MQVSRQLEAATVSSRLLREKEAARAFLRSSITDSSLALEIAAKRLEAHARRTMNAAPLTTCVILCPAIEIDGEPAAEHHDCPGEPVGV
ncbi:MAG TPA: hypothetical protein VK176_10955 [Phycisphaerales bacterium]|nr:hypothetical protein [Phycisphaerales bacterium]